MVSDRAIAQHGLRRTNADKRRAVTTILRDQKFSEEYDSDQKVADLCKVSDRFVAKVRKELGVKRGTPNGSESEVRTGRDGRTQNVSSGKRSEAARGRA